MSLEKKAYQVNIVLNVYNAEEVIEDFLDSLAKQTFQNFKLLVVDDGSTDSTVEKIEKYKDKFDMVLYKLSHQGLRKARKFGVDKARGDIILILDADLILDKNAVKELVKPLKEEDIGAVGGVLKGGEKGSIAKAYAKLREIFYRLRTKKGEVDWINGGFCGIKKEVIDLVGGYTEDDISEDLDISWRIKNKGYKLLLNSRAIAYHLDPSCLREVWERERNIGYREYELTKRYPRESLKMRRLIRFYPLFFLFLMPFLIIFYWPILIILLLISYLGVLLVVKDSLEVRNAAWIVFNVMNIAYCVGFLSGLFKRRN